MQLCRLVLPLAHPEHLRLAKHHQSTSFSLLLLRQIVEQTSLLPRKSESQLSFAPWPFFFASRKNCSVLSCIHAHTNTLSYSFLPTLKHTSQPPASWALAVKSRTPTAHSTFGATTTRSSNTSTLRLHQHQTTKTTTCGTRHILPRIRDTIIITASLLRSQKNIVKTRKHILLP